MISRPLTIELALLGYLRDSPLHGYQIYQRLLQPGGLGQVWRLKQAQLYALLGKLEEAGFIQGVAQVQETRPTRHVYHLTHEGQKAFQTWVLSPVNTPRQIRQEFLAKLYFAQQNNEQALIALLNKQLKVCQGWAERLPKQSTTVPEGSFNQAVYHYRLGQIQATLAWLQHLKSDAIELHFPDSE